MAARIDRATIENWLLIAGGLGLAYVLYQIYQTVTNPNKGTPYEGYGLPGTIAHGVNILTGGAPEAIGNWTGGAIYDWLNPPTTPGVTYVVAFPDGSSHAIDPATVDPSGNFAYQGNAWVLKVNAAGAKFAIPFAG